MAKSRKRPSRKAFCADCVVELTYEERPLSGEMLVKCPKCKKLKGKWLYDIPESIKT